MKNKKELMVITGGAGGIGTATAKKLKDYHLIITDYSKDLVDEAVDRLKKEGFNASGIPCDITDKQDVDNLVKFVAESGTFKGLIHTAGVSGTVNNIEKIYDIDLSATDILINAFYKIAQPNSSAVLLSSMMAHTVPANSTYDKALSNPQEAGSFDTVSEFVKGDPNQMYNYAKRGVQLLSRKYATKWGEKGARILTVSPGIIETPMAKKANDEHPEEMQKIKKATPLQRNGTPEDVADVIDFLVSDKARFITATDILVDGGVIHTIKKWMNK